MRRTQWHRVEHTDAPLGHALTARIRGQTWRTFEDADGSWLLEPVDPPGQPVRVGSLSEARELTEPMARATNPQIDSGGARRRLLVDEKPVWKVEYLPFLDTDLDRRAREAGFSSAGFINELFDSAGDARRRYAAIKATEEAELVRLYGLKPGRRGGWEATLLQEDPYRGTIAYQRRNPNGRRFEAEDWAAFALEGIAPGAEITPELRKAAQAFELGVDQALDECFERFPPAVDPIDLYADPQTAYDVWATLAGEGLGIWDGRWDHLYPKAKRRHWNRLTSCLREELAGPYGALDFALQDAAVQYMETNPTHRRVKRLANRLSR